MEDPNTEMCEAVGCDKPAVIFIRDGAGEGFCDEHAEELLGRCYGCGTYDYLDELWDDLCDACEQDEAEDVYLGGYDDTDEDQ